MHTIKYFITKHINTTIQTMILTSMSLYEAISPHETLAQSVQTSIKQKEVSFSDIATIIAPGNMTIKNIINHMGILCGNPCIVLHTNHEQGKRSYYDPQDGTIHLYPASYKKRLLDHLIAELSHAAQNHLYRYQNGPILEPYDQKILNHPHDNMPDLNTQSHTVRLRNPDGTAMHRISTQDSTLIVTQEFGRFLTPGEKQQRGYNPTDIVITRPGYIALADSLNAKLGSTYTPDQIADRMKYQSDQVDVGGDTHDRRKHHEEYMTHAVTERAIRERYNQQLRNTLPIDQIEQYLLPIYPYNPPTGPSDGSQQGAKTMNPTFGRELITKNQSNITYSDQIKIDRYLKEVIFQLSNTHPDHHIRSIIKSSNNIQNDMILRMGMDTTNKQSLYFIWLARGISESPIVPYFYHQISTMQQKQQDITGWIIDIFLSKEVWKLNDRSYLIDTIGYHPASIVHLIGSSSDPQIIQEIQSFLTAYSPKNGTSIASDLINFLYKSENQQIQQLIKDYNKNLWYSMIQEHSGTISMFFPPNTRQDIFWDRVERTNNTTTQTLKEMIQSYIRRTTQDHTDFSMLMKSLFKSFGEYCIDNNIDSRSSIPTHPTMTPEQIEKTIQNDITTIIKRTIQDMPRTGEDANTLYIDYNDMVDIVTSYQAYIHPITTVINNAILKELITHTKDMSPKPTIEFDIKTGYNSFTENHLPQLITLGTDYTSLSLLLTQNASNDSFAQLKKLLSTQPKLYELHLIIQNNTYSGDLKRLENVLQQLSKNGKSELYISLSSFSSTQAQYIIDTMKQDNSFIYMKSKSQSIISLVIKDNPSNLIFDNIAIDFSKHQGQLPQDIGLDMMNGYYDKSQGQALGRILSDPAYYEPTSKPTHTITLNNHSHKDIDMILGFIESFNHPNGSNIHFVLPSGLSTEDMNKLTTHIQQIIDKQTSSYNIFIGNSTSFIKPIFLLSESKIIGNYKILKNGRGGRKIESSDSKRSLTIQK